MRRGLGLTLLAAILASACGSGKAPTEPSTTGTVGGTPVGPSATITGTVQGATGSALTSASSGAALTGVTVSVMGTNLSTSVDGAGRFTLAKVPTGAVQLQLTGHNRLRGRVRFSWTAGVPPAHLPPPRPLPKVSQRP